MTGAPIGDPPVVWDNHGCMPLRADAKCLPQLQRYRDAGVDVVSVNVGFAHMSWKEHIQVLSFMRQWIVRHPDEYCLIAAADDIPRCKAEGRLGIVFDIEGMCPVQDDLSLVQTFYELGVRWMLVAYNRNNKAGGGCLDEDCGLTDLGKAIIDEMERVGMVLCLSHTGARTAAAAIEYSNNPVIFSHSNPHACAAHPRNISDELMRACARKGGVVGLTGAGPFLGARDQLVAHLLRHLRYAIDLVGAEHVGLSLDYVFDRADADEYLRRNPLLIAPGIDAPGGFGVVAPESMNEIAEGLARDKLTDGQIRGVLGENWRRVARQVWR